jgi:hypothetical protein
LSDGITPSRNSTVPMGAGAQVLQKAGVLGAKAALSTIPWAALVFDLGQAAVDYGNARLTDRLLADLGERIDRMEAGTRERLKADEIYQLSAQAAIRRMLMETNPRMADALARAVVELGVSDLEPTERMEIARALDALTEPALHLLQTQYRAKHDLLTEPELQVIGGDVKEPMRFMALMYASMRLTSWLAPTLELERAGMIAVTLDNGTLAEAHTATMAIRGQVVHLQEVYPAGERVVRMCFEDPALPAFGTFAAPTVHPQGEREP